MSPYGIDIYDNPEHPGKPFVQPGSITPGAYTGQGDIYNSELTSSPDEGLFPGGLLGVGKAIGRGALRGLDEMGDLILPEDWFQVSDERAGGITGILESIAQFTIGFVIPGGAIGKAALAGKLGARLAGAGGWAKAGRGVLKGAAADFTAFDGHTERLSNVLVQMDNPLLNNQISQFLASDEEDSELLGRIKNTIEGAGLGVVAEGIGAGLSRMWKLGKSPGRREIAENLQEFHESLNAGKQLDEAGNPIPAEMAPLDVVDFREAEFTALTEEELRLFKLPLRSFDGSEPFLPYGVNHEVPGGYGFPSVMSWKQPAAIALEEEEAIKARMLLGGEDRETVTALYERTKMIDEQFDFDGPISAAEFDGLILGKNSMKFLNLRHLGSKTSPAKGQALWTAIETESLTSIGSDLRKALKNNPQSVTEMVLGAMERTASWSNISFDEYHAHLKTTTETFEDLATQVLAHRVQLVAHSETAAISIRDAIKEGTDEAFVGSMSDLFRLITIGGHVKGQASISGRVLRSHQISLESLGSEKFVGADSTQAPGSKAVSFLGTEVNLEQAQAAKDAFQLMDAFGGLEHLKEEAERAVKIYEEGGADSFIRYVMANKHPNLHSNVFGMVKQLWVGNLLSGPQTWVVNGFGTFANINLRVAQQFVGGLGHAAVTGNTEGIAASFHQLMGMYGSVGAGMRNFVRSMKNNRGALFPDSRVFDQREGMTDWMIAMDKERALAGKEATNAYSREARGKIGTGNPLNPSSDYGPLERVYEMAMASTGYATSFPGRLLGATDTWLKTMSYFGSARASLYRRGHKLASKGKLAPEKLADWVEARLSQMTLDDGAYLSRANLMQQFEKQARKKQLTGLAKEEFVGKRFAEAMEQDFEGILAKDMHAIAAEGKAWAEEGTWTNQFNPYTQKIAKSLQSFKNKNPWMAFVTPFIQTPANIFADARQHMDFTGPIRHMIARFQDPKNLKKAPSLKQFQTKFTQDIASGDPVKVSQAYGRIAFGMTTMAWMASLASTGQITVRGPSDPEERESLRLAGWQPYSFRIPKGFTRDTNAAYVSYNRLDPFATVAGMVADMWHYSVYKDDTDQSDFESVLMAATTAIANQVTQKTFMTGVRQAVGALDRPDKNMPGFFRQTVGALAVPTFLSNMTASSTGLWSEDQDLREVRSMLDAVTNRIPGMSTNLEPRRNILGEPIKKTTRLGDDTIGAHANLWMPIVYSEVSDRVLDQELGKMAYGFTPPSKRKDGLDLLHYRSEAGQSAFDRWGELQGQVEIGGDTLREALTDIIRSARYQSLPESEVAGENTQRVDMLRRVMRRYRTRAFHAVLTEFPDYAQDYQNARMGKFQRRASLDYSQYDPRSSALAKIFPQ